MDKFQAFKTTLDSPISNGFAITPNNDADLGFVTRGLYVGVTGDVVLELHGSPVGTTLTLKNLAAGVVHPLRVRKVHATNTTATFLVGLY